MQQEAFFIKNVKDNVVRAYIKMPVTYSILMTNTKKRSISRKVGLGLLVVV